jgi:aminoglycoside phosphotransferase (APT) family kinase protein
MIGPRDEAPELVLKLPHDPEGVASLRRQREVQAALHRDARLRDWRALIPKPLVEGQVGGDFFFSERALAGRSALRQLTDPQRSARIKAAAAVTITELHQRTSASVTVDERLLARWVDRPLGFIRSVASEANSAAGRHAAFERLRRELYEALEGRNVHVGWIHGDYWPGNLLLAGESETPVGIVDWDRAAAEELRWHDLFHLLVQTRKFLRGDAAVDVAAILLGEHPWTSDERTILDHARMAMPDDRISDRAVGLLYWLRHTAGTLTLYPHNAGDDEYVSRNIDRVLERLEVGTSNDRRRHPSV